jgi:hypothetical protein
MIHTLILNRPTLLKIEEVKIFSREHPMGIDELKQAIMRKTSQAGDRFEHIVEIPVDYRLVYNIEEQPDANLYHHLSISCKNGKIPSPALVTDLMSLFDMGYDLMDMDNVWIEGKIVNLLKIWKKYEDRGL